VLAIRYDALDDGEDKFVLHEKMKGSCQEIENVDQNQKSCGPETAIQYETLGLVKEG
jgi:hypothetical protein